MKFKILLVVLIVGVFTLNAQNHEHNHNTGKRVLIEKPNQNIINKLIISGVDLRCGALYTKDGLQLELTTKEVFNLEKNEVSFEVLIDDLTKYYADRAAKDLPLAKAKLASEKAKRKKKVSYSNKASNSVTNVELDNPLQYYGETEIDWTTPSNFIYGSMGGCLTVSEMEAQLDLMKSKFPTLITTKKSASPSNQITHGFAGSGGWSGKTVWYVKISDGIAIDDVGDGDLDQADEPDILYTSMIHSRELSALMGNIYFMWYLLENYSTDPAIKSLVDNNELFFVPVVNPDGLRWNERIAPGGGGLQRKNLRGYTNDDYNATPDANDSPTGLPFTSNTDPTSNSSFSTYDGVDPNRNFDYLWGTAGDAGGSDNDYSSNLYRGHSAFSEPETQIMRDFVLSKKFKTAVWQHSYANAIPHPYGGLPTKVSGREDEMAKWHEDMSRYNRYMYGAQVLNSANGIADDWMMGGTIDSNDSVGSGMNILATTPENGATSGEGGFWPSTADIIPIAKRMMRINFMNAYYGGKYAKLHDLTPSNVTALTSNLSFGIERIGQTSSDFTITVTPISSNILSVGDIINTNPITEPGMSVLEQRNVSIPLTLDTGIVANDKIEYTVTLSNGDFTIYEAKFEKYYNPTVLSSGTDLDNIANWTSSGTWASSTIVFSGLNINSIKGGDIVEPYSEYSNTISSSTLTTTNSYDLSSSDRVLVQFYAKWDLERNFDFVEIEGYNGSSWIKLNGKYNKPESSSFTNNARSYYDNDKNSYLNSQAASSGLVYDGDRMDNWVQEEIIIDASNNSALFNATNARFRFRFVTDGNNNGEVNYSSSYEGFYFDEFKVIEILCSTSVPSGLSASSITSSGASINWDNITLVDYDLRYKETSSSTWLDVLDLTTNTHNLTGLSVSTEYEVQVRSKCDVSTTSAYSSSITFITLACTAPILTGLTINSETQSGATANWDASTGQYDLRYRQNGILTWTEVQDLTTNSYDFTNLLINTQYDVEVRSKCSSSTFSPYTTTVLTTLDYCSAAGNSVADEYISNVKLGGVSNSSPSQPASGFSDFTSFTGFPDLDLGSQYNIEVTKEWTSTLYNEAVVVLIDFNNNGVFEASEKVLDKSSDQVSPVTSDFIVPTLVGTEVELGSTRMRVIMKWYNSIGSTINDFCEDTFGYGEVEDYTINIIDSTLGIQDELLSKFNVYPNPTSNGIVNLDVPNEITDFRVSVSSLLGQKVYSENVKLYNTNKHTINLNKLASGIYLLTVSTDLGRASKKIIIE